MHAFLLNSMYSYFNKKCAWLKEANAVFLFCYIIEEVGMFYTKISKQLNILVRDYSS